MSLLPNFYTLYRRVVGGAVCLWRGHHDWFEGEVCRVCWKERKKG